jgi:hypothetical protein
MNLASLQHLAVSARTLADDCAFVVIGSASLLASFPELGNDGGPLAQTFDADICPQPFDETTALMLDQALGQARAFHLRHGYHADIVRPSIFETLPAGWSERLVPVPNAPGTRALEPHDLAAAKILVGRPKDLSLIKLLLKDGHLKKDVIEERLHLIEMDERLHRRVARQWHEICQE